KDLDLWFVWQPGRGPAERAAKLLSRLRKARRTGVEGDEEALKHLQDKISDGTAGRKRVEPRMLARYEQDGIRLSETSEIL
ncbi:transporter, partial [Rhizobium ruizarguesonis]